MIAEFKSDTFVADHGLWALGKLRDVVGKHIEGDADAEHFYFIAEQSFKECSIQAYKAIRASLK